MLFASQFTTILSIDEGSSVLAREPLVWKNMDYIAARRSGVLIRVRQAIHHIEEFSCSLRD